MPAGTLAPPAACTDTAMSWPKTAGFGALASVSVTGSVPTTNVKFWMALRPQPATTIVTG